MKTQVNENYLRIKKIAHSNIEEFEDTRIYALLLTRKKVAQELDNYEDLKQIEKIISEIDNQLINYLILCPTYNL